MLVPPKTYVLDDSAKVIGLDGEKMSKSYGNTVEIFETPGRLKKKCNSIVTDSLSVEDVKDPESDNVFALYRLFATPAEREELAAKYRAGGTGYGEAKKALIAAATAYFAPARDRRTDWESRPDDVEDVLRAGAARARAVGGEVLDRVRSARRVAGAGHPGGAAMIVGLGTDIIECDRIADLIGRHGDAFTHRVFTPAERDYCDRHKHSAENYAGRWAAKEAAMKALGTGFAPPVRWHDFEILPDPQGAPGLTIAGGARGVLEARGGRSALVSISHCRTYATATVILLAAAPAAA